MEKLKIIARLLKEERISIEEAAILIEKDYFYYPYYNPIYPSIQSPVYTPPQVFYTSESTNGTISH